MSLRRTMVPMVTVLLAFVGAVQAAGPKLPPGKWWENERVVRELGLTPEQQETIHDVVFDHAQRMIDLNAAVKRAELTLGDLADREPFDEASVRSAWQRFVKARTALENERFELLVAVRKVLTTDQWKRLRKLREMRRRRPGERRPPGPQQGGRRPPREPLPPVPSR